MVSWYASSRASGAFCASLVMDVHFAPFSSDSVSFESVFALWNDAVSDAPRPTTRRPSLSLLSAASVRNTASQTSPGTPRPETAIVKKGESLSVVLPVSTLLGCGQRPYTGWQATATSAASARNFMARRKKSKRPVDAGKKRGTL